MTVYLLHITFPVWQTKAAALSAHVSREDRDREIRFYAAKNYCGGGSAIASWSTAAVIRELRVLGYHITFDQSELPDAPPVVVEDATREALAVIRSAAARLWIDLTVSGADAAVGDTILCRAINHLQRTR